ncbi:MAG: hypothetical protein ABIJ20_00395 [Nanoarchaeota archaeon]|nr:hypothetical protein [Nanoarchaeota archaeon]MBU1445152.1 hypothetical protein [Nanoarchaeota archaeon]MBU2406370.1 hypothetical protein [Nanoarchaeota archaeon]MBU2420334.1 hypothetical protein [Nanoarchaeota archaeon]MBU2475601.1 hypothetical protein [Nanoarchaeota archaeon]
MEEMKKIDQKVYEKTLKWIVRLLKKRKIQFNVLGGLAAYAYGSKRMLVDIDLTMKNEDFQKILSDVKDYVIEPPHFSKSENWECYYMELEKDGITIEIGGDKGCKFLDSKTRKWEKLGDSLSKPTIKEVFGIDLPIISKNKLIRYKKKLMREVDVIDLKNLS